MRKTVHEPVAHLVKRVDMDRKKAWLIRLIAFALSILACAIITTAITKKDMGFFCGTICRNVLFKCSYAWRSVLSGNYSGTSF